MGGTRSGQAWHIVAGDWRPLDQAFERGSERLWCIIGSRFVREFDSEIQRDTLKFSALELPFYAGTLNDDRVFRYVLVEVCLPEDVDAVRLLRWVYFLWDGDADLTLLDGDSKAIHDFNLRVGIDLGPPESDQHRARAAQYLVFFAAFIAGSGGPRIEPDMEKEREDDFGSAGSPDRSDIFRSPFLLITSSGAVAWTDSAQAQVLAALPAAARNKLDESALQDRLALLPPPAAEADEPANFCAYQSPAVEDDSACVCVYGRNIFRAQLKVVFRSLKDGRWRDGIPEILDDVTLATVDALRPLFCTLRPGSIAFVCADRHELPRSIPLAPERMATLLLSPRFRGACRGRRSDFDELIPKDQPDRANVEDALRLLAMHWWQAPVGRSRIDVTGDLQLAPPGDEVLVPLEADGPVRVQGHLVFQNVRLRSPLRLRHWLIMGRVEGQNARAQSVIALQDVTVRNGIAKGLRTEGFSAVATYPSKAVKLDELRSEASIDLRGLRAEGQVSMRNAAVEGRVSLDAANIEVNPRTRNCDVLLDQARVGAVQMVGMKAKGVVSLAQAQVLADVNFDELEAAGIDAQRANIGGGLSLRRAALASPFGRVAFNAEEVRIGGSLDLGEASMFGHTSPAAIVLRRASVHGVLNASGLCVMVPYFSDTAIMAENLFVGGDLLLNRIRPVESASLNKKDSAIGLADLSPTLVRGTIDLSNATIKGSFIAFWFHVTGDLKFQATDVGRDLVVSGLARFDPVLHGAVPLAASASYVRGMRYTGGQSGGINLYQAKIGGHIDLAGTICAMLEFDYARAAGGLYAQTWRTEIPLHVLAPASDRGEVTLSAAEIFNVEIEGMQCERPVRSVSLRTGSRVRLAPAKSLPRLAADTVTMHSQAESLLRAWADDPVDAPRADLTWGVMRAAVVAFEAASRKALAPAAAGQSSPEELQGCRPALALLVQTLGRILTWNTPLRARWIALNAFRDTAGASSPPIPESPFSGAQPPDGCATDALLAAWREAGFGGDIKASATVTRLLGAFRAGLPEPPAQAETGEQGTAPDADGVSIRRLSSVWTEVLNLELRQGVPMVELMRALETLYGAARSAIARPPIPAAADDTAYVEAPTRIGGHVRMLELQCGGGLELLAVSCESLELRNARIDGDLRLHLDDLSGTADARAASQARVAEIRGDVDVQNTTVAGRVVLDRAQLGGAVRFHDVGLRGGLRAIDARIAHALSIRNATIAGASELQDTVVSGLDIADSRLDGAFLATRFGAQTEAGAQANAFVRLNNIRTQADLVFRGTAAGDCRIEDSTIGGDLRFLGDQSEGQFAATPSTEAVRNVLGALRITGCRIDGQLQLDQVEVERDIDLSDSHAVRGLLIGPRDDANVSSAHAAPSDGEANP